MRRDKQAREREERKRKEREGRGGNPRPTNRTPKKPVPKQPDAGVPKQPDAGVPKQPDAGVPKQPDAEVEAKETLKDKLTREREERKLELELKNFAARSERGGNPRSTNPARAQELQSRIVALQPVVAPPPVNNRLPAPAIETSPRLLPFDVHSIALNAGVWQCKVRRGKVPVVDPTLGVVAISYLTAPVDDTVVFDVSANHTLYCRVETNGQDLPTAATIVSLAEVPVTVHAQPEQPDGEGFAFPEVLGDYWYKLADFEMVNDQLVIRDVYQVGGPLNHRPGRHGLSGTLTLQDCAGAIGAFLNFTQGQMTSIIENQIFEAEACAGGTS